MEQKDALKLKQLHDSAFLASPVGGSFRVYDLEHHMRRFLRNPKLCELFKRVHPLTEEVMDTWNAEDDQQNDRIAFEHNGIYNFEIQVRNFDGSTLRWLSVYKKAEPYGDDEIIVVTTYTDVTQRKKAEILNQSTLASIAQLAKLTDCFFFSYKVGTKFIDVFGGETDNHFLKTDFGYESFYDNLFPDDKPMFTEKERQLRMGEIPSFNSEVRMKADDGSYQYYSISECAIVDTDGNDVLLGSCQNIHASKMERLEREHMATMSDTMFNMIPVGVEIYDKNACLVRLNKKDMELFGIPADNVPVGQSLYVHPFLNDEQKDMIRNGQAFDMVMKYNFDDITQHNYYTTSCNGVKFFNLQFTPLVDAEGNIFGYMDVVVDTTELNYKNFQLEQLSRNLDLALKAGDVSAWIYYPDKQWFDTLKGDALAGEGVSLEESQGWLHPNDRQMQNDIFKELAENKRSQASAVFRYIQEDGMYHHFESRMITDVVNGKVVSITGTQRDITDTVMAEHKMKNLMQELDNNNTILREIVDNIPLQLVIKDATDSYRYVMVNESFCQLVGKKHEELEGKLPVNMVLGLPGDYFVNKDKEAVEKNEATICDETFVINGKTHHLQSVRKPVKMNNGHTYVIHIVTDVTHLKQANKALEKAKQAAEQADRLKSTFVANMSHEIRTPLNAIVGFSDVLQAATTVEEKEMCADFINRNTEILLRLINDILDLSKIEAGKITIRQDNFDVCDVLNQVVADMKNKLANKPIEVLLRCEYSKCVVRFDRQRLTQIVNNFMSNAAKYTERGYIMLQMEYRKNGVMVKVSDTGIGIKKEDQPKVFGRFNKFDEFAQGTGLGLSICKAIIDTVGGRVGFNSEKGKGSTFWAWVPCELIEQNFTQ